MLLVNSFIWNQEKERRSSWRNPTFLPACFSAPTYSKVRLQGFLWTARQCHSLSMLGLGFVALAIVYVAHTYITMVKFPLPSLNRERFPFSDIVHPCQVTHARFSLVWFHAPDPHASFSLVWFHATDPHAPFSLVWFHASDSTIIEYILISHLPFVWCGFTGWYYSTVHPDQPPGVESPD